jgi:hypothetical protein
MSSDLSMSSDFTLSSVALNSTHLNSTHLNPSHSATTLPLSQTSNGFARLERREVRISGNNSNNRLRGTSRNDTIRGAGGNDRLFGLSGNDRLFGDRGNDSLAGGAGNDILTDTVGNNRFQGDAGNDRIIGGRGNDILSGGAGDDILIGGSGSDQLTGGGGRDRFVLSRSGSATPVKSPLVRDFTKGQDVLQIKGLTFSQLAIAQGTGANINDTIVKDKATQQTLAVLRNIDRNRVDLSDFSDALNGIFAFSASNLRVNEGAGTATVTVVRTGNTAGRATVNYRTENNTAIAGSDYGSRSSTLTFEAGETSKSFTIPILQDSTFEFTEVVRLTLSDATNESAIGAGTALLKIVNDDNPTEAELSSKTTQKVTSGNTTIYIGTASVSTGNDIGNKDPWAASFTNGVLNWYNDDYEVTNDDSSGTQLVWDGGDRLYATFTSTGTQGTEAEDFRRFAKSGWLKSYTDGSPQGGGGGRVSILARLNPTNGDVQTATFLTALNGQKTNSLFVESMALSGDNLVVQAKSAFAPRKPNKSAMVRKDGVTADPNLPNYTVEFAPDLGSVISAVSVDYI